MCRNNQLTPEKNRNLQKARTIGIVCLQEKEICGLLARNTLAIDVKDDRRA